MSPVIECMACLQQMDGYSKSDLQADGWKWEPLRKGRFFIVCDTCVKRFEQRRLEREAEHAR